MNAIPLSTTISGSFPQMVEVLEGVEHRLAEATQDFVRREKAADWMGNFRLVLALFGLALLLAPLVTRSGTSWWALIPLTLVFVALGAVQDRLIEKRRVAAAHRDYLQSTLDRLQERWRDLPDTGDDLAEHHDRRGLASDLDLFGSASLFQRLCRAVTTEGRATLARWLVEVASLGELRSRQRAAEALAADEALRRRAYAAAASESAKRPLADEALIAWATDKAPIPGEKALRLLGLIQPSLLLASVLIAYGLGGPREPMYIFALAQVATLLATRGLTGPRAYALSGPERVLSRYARLIDWAESIPEGRAERLDELRKRLSTDGRSASEELRGLERLVNLLDARLNMFFAMSLGPALMWELNLVLLAERWRRRVGPRLSGWLSVLAELEALASLGALAAERPDYGFPEFVEEPGVYEAEHLCHPLIDRRRVVANDLRLAGPGSVLLLSGSNMSGKSTLLRAVGLSVVMAGAGGPVAARSLRLSSVRLSTSVRVSDSLAEGASHFYAEVTRLKEVMDRAQARGATLLYLLDEILHGTNSRERIIGAISVVRWLAQTGSMGIVTTHDLELMQLEKHLPSGKMRNAHFSDDVSQDALHFDYLLREGPIQTTNALRLMRAVGIDVELVEV